MQLGEVPHDRLRNYLVHDPPDCKLNPVRHTKIVATLGPASSSDSMLDELIDAGVNVFRLNFSHGTHETHAGDVRARARRGRAERRTRWRCCRT